MRACAGDLRLAFLALFSLGLPGALGVILPDAGMSSFDISFAFSSFAVFVLWYVSLHLKLITDDFPPFRFLFPFHGLLIHLLSSPLNIKRDAYSIYTCPNIFNARLGRICSILAHT
ncbi:hypothetical protein BV22DRAFT_1039494 [Leucogyrophana mollusca]|uniref:Uncharacterized protein n=1 Tax=Leucogyrophana mollusca TaxID=85980 RepID=A0ACB8B751_9AGAM|nr:hypothetical protein BV22DRAFT_1039494 [Leucogyrophana mollusca]